MNLFNFNNIGLRNKLLIIYIVSVFLPITLTHTVFYYITTENVKSQRMHDLSLSVEQMKNEFLKGVDDAVGVSSVLYADNNLYTFLETDYQSEVDFIKAYNSYYRDISKYVPIYSSIESISVYSDNESIIYAGGIYEIDEFVEQSHWYLASELFRSSYPVLTKTSGDAGNLDTFSVIRDLDYYQGKRTQSILKIDLNRDLIKKRFNNVTFPGDVYLLNDVGVVEYTTNPTIDWANRRQYYRLLDIPKNAVVLEENYDAQYLNDWKVIGVVPEDVLYQEVRDSRNFIIYLALINLILPSLFIIYITSSLHVRILRILRHMRKVEDRNFELIEGTEFQDEIGELTKAFNRMAKKIKSLINDVYVASLQKKDLELQRRQAQLSALQSQINPHFLFNVLETIRMRSLLKKEDETAKIIQNMAKILRTSISWGKDWVTVKEELQLVQSFLEIQEYRFVDKMNSQIDVDESAYDCIIPNMTIIPFVENASIHGIEPMKGKGFISIRVKRENNQLVCLIKDNGVGMKEENYQQLIKSLEEQEEIIGDSIGIKNVYYRLKMHYRDDFEFEITSTEQQGTEVKIILPVDS